MGAVLLDQVAFEQERLELGVGDDELEIGDARDHLARLRREAVGRAEVGADAVLEAARLADIDDLVADLHQVDARLVGQGAQRLGEARALLLVYGEAALGRSRDGRGFGIRTHVRVGT